jgi:hypothetical protein
MYSNNWSKKIKNGIQKNTNDKEIDKIYFNSHY